MQNLEKTLFESADKLRKNIDASEYKHVGACVSQIH
nr:type I restriction-modification system subunit M N-terminal domain-containing protein [Helicobacter didelphidarum]